jgi:hypothetical protein
MRIGTDFHPCRPRQSPVPSVWSRDAVLRSGLWRQVELTHQGGLAPLMRSDRWPDADRVGVRIIVALDRAEVAGDGEARPPARGRIICPTGGLLPARGPNGCRGSTAFRRYAVEARESLGSFDQISRRPSPVALIDREQLIGWG